MPTAEEFRREIEDHYRIYAAELEQAGPGWERGPGGATGGEEAWSPRQVAEHVAGACTAFGAGIAFAIGLDGRPRQQFQFSTAPEAVAATAAAHESLMNILGSLTDDHLQTEVDAGRLGRTTLGAVVGIANNHYVDHADQLKALRGG